MHERPASRLSIPESHLAQEVVAAIVDGELPAGPAGRAARHLTGCAQCRMAVQAQREAKAALREAAEVAVPGDLVSRLCAIPFTAEVPGPGAGTLSAAPGGLRVQGPTGGWSVDLGPGGAAPGGAAPGAGAPGPLGTGGRPDRAGQARWLRRGIAGTGLGLGLGVALLAVALPGDDGARNPRTPVAGVSAGEERTEVVPPVTRTLLGGPGSAGEGRP